MKKVYRVVLQLDIMVDTDNVHKMGEDILAALRADINDGWLTAGVLQNSVVEYREVREYE